MSFRSEIMIIRIGGGVFDYLNAGIGSSRDPDDGFGVR